jgi:hypothetical protein
MLEIGCLTANGAREEGSHDDFKADSGYQHNSKPINLVMTVTENASILELRDSNTH